MVMMMVFGDDDGEGSGYLSTEPTLQIVNCFVFFSSFSVKDKRSYSCPVCEKSFSEDRLIKSHIKTNHPGKVMNFRIDDYFLNTSVYFET